ncbi:hypothetical protein HON22_03120 [Candidatus Peregrinibacteria bacterium]|jgi:hypothetical protein|nr:hypothetical protein [Candidatus Peregrinibacteria bacterium]
MIATNLIDLEKLLFKTNLEQDWGTLILEILFSFTLAIALLIAFIAMFIVLLIRVAVLWIGFIICPIAVFAFFDIFGLQEKVKSGLSQIVAHAFIPAVFGLVLSLAFIVIGQLSLENISVTVESSKTVILASSVLGSTHPLFQLLLSVLVIVLLWIGLFNAMRLSEIATPIINTIDTTAKNVGKWAAKTPLYLNFLPVPGGGGKVRQDLASAWKDSLGGINKKMGRGDDMDDLSRKVKSGDVNIKATSDTGKKAQNEIISLLKDKRKNGSLINNITTNVKNGNFNEAIKNATSIAMNGRHYKNVKNGKDKQAIIADIISQVTKDAKQEMDLTNYSDMWKAVQRNIDSGVAKLSDVIGAVIKKKPSESSVKKALTKAELFKEANDSQLKKAFEAIKKENPNGFGDIQELINWLTTPNANHLKAVKNAAGITL